MVSANSSAFPPPSPIIPAIVEQYAEEAAFLWSLRDAVTERPHYGLRQLAILDERIEAQIDGLRIAGQAGLGIALERLDQHRQPGEFFVASTLSLEWRRETDTEKILTSAESVPEGRRGLFGALGWASRDALRGQVVDWLNSPSAFRRLLGVVACSLHRADPGSRIERLLQDEPLVRARTLRLVGELGALDHRDRVRLAMKDEEEECRFWAAWSAGLLGERPVAIRALQAYAVGDSPFKWPALDLVVRLMDHDSAISWIRDLRHDPNNARLLITAAGILGDAAVVPWLIEKMRTAALARAAGESFSMITGIDLSKGALSRRAPEEVVTGPNDDPNDENVAIDADENLPWPDPDNVQARWETKKRDLAPGIRHLRGIPLTREGRSRVLRDGDQRQRRAAAFDLALIDIGRPLWNWRARADLQLMSLRASPPSLT
jgi:uncharacterized protein (TIGR02270 family)